MIARKKIQISGPFLVFAVLFIIVFILSDVLYINNIRHEFIFFNIGNILNILNQVAMNAIIAFGMTFVIIILGIDLSVGSQVAVVGVVFVGLYQTFNFPFLLALIITLIVGLAMGAFNGVITAKLKIPAFIVTLGSTIMLRGVALEIVDGKPIFIEDPVFLFIGNGTLLGIPFPIIILAVMFVFYSYLLHYRKLGRYTFAIGGNEDTARFSGIDVDLVKIKIFTLVGFSCFISGMILASRLGSGQPSIGEGYELNAITATVIGGTSMAGGIGTIAGTLAGALIVGVIDNGMNILGISSYLQLVVKGLVILFAVMIDTSSKDNPISQLKEVIICKFGAVKKA